MNSAQFLSIILLAIVLIGGLLGVIYKTLNTRIDSNIARIDNKVDKEVYIQTVDSIHKALDKINGTAEKLHLVVERVSDIQDKYLTIKEHEYICQIKRQNENK